MKEGTVPVPHTAPALSDDDVAPGGYRIGGATAAGAEAKAEAPMSVIDEVSGYIVQKS
jgi:hypothetical protein